MAALDLSLLNLYTKGTRVWAWQPEARHWLAAKVVSSERYEQNGQSHWRLVYQDANGKEHKMDEKESALVSTTAGGAAACLGPSASLAMPPPLQNPASQDGQDDLTQLSYLHEPGVLFNIEARYRQQSIYTYSGIVLIAVNPFERLAIYSPEVIRSYAGQPRAELEPHLFAIAESALRSMASACPGPTQALAQNVAKTAAAPAAGTAPGRNQSIIISGESGAGKTVSAKYIMRYLATADKLDDHMSPIEEQLLATNPILESFGNAQTVRNDNSSRFGKYIQILFSSKSDLVAAATAITRSPRRSQDAPLATIVGARLRTYLLEKSRIVSQAKGERNYHIYYQLLAGLTAEERESLGLESVDWRHYHYLNQGGEASFGGICDEAASYAATKRALSLVGLSEETQAHVFRLLAVILHLGNIDIQGSRESSRVDMGQPALVAYCRLAGIAPSAFVQWLTTRTIATRHETIQKQVSRGAAVAIRDSIAKTLYAALFDWLVAQMNQSLCVEAEASHAWIGILDIYGFEHFATNSFEQFCINYANEKLQQEFNRHVFRLEQELYADEGIQWSYIDYHDNKTTIEMIEGKLGILDLLDEETKLAQATDVTFTQKLAEHIGRQEKYKACFGLPKRPADAFQVHHFAYSVTYDASGFLEKNRETLPEEQLLLLASSSNAFLARLFAKQLPSLPSPQSRKSAATLGSHFKHSLDQLMRLIAETQVHYIRCIKPSETKRPFHFDPPYVLAQLRSCGVLETIRISCAGYPARYSFHEFAERYYMLVRSAHHKEPDRELAERILARIRFPCDQYQMGRTRLFFRAGQTAHIERLRRAKIEEAAVMLQKWARGCRQRRRLRQLQGFVLAMTTACRRYMGHRRWLALVKERLCIVLQTLMLRRHTILASSMQRRAVQLVQIMAKTAMALKGCRAGSQAKLAFRAQVSIRQWLARRAFCAAHSRLVLLQSCYRSRLGRLALRAYRSEARSVTRLQEQSFQLENTVLSMRRALEEKDAQLKSIQSLEVSLAESQRLYEELRVRHAELLESFAAGSKRLVALESELQAERVQAAQAEGRYRELEATSVGLREANERLAKSLAEIQSGGQQDMPVMPVIEREAAATGGGLMPMRLASPVSPQSKLIPVHDLSEHEAAILLQDTTVESELLENLLLNLKIPFFDDSSARPSKQEVLFPVQLVHFRAALLWAYGLLDRLSSLVLKTTSAAERQAKACEGAGARGTRQLDVCLFWISFLCEFHGLLEGTLGSATHRPFSVTMEASSANTSYSESFLARFKDHVLEGIRDTVQQIYQAWSREARHALDRLAIPALLDTQGLTGYTAPHWTVTRWFSGMFGGSAATRLDSHRDDASAAMEAFLDRLDQVYSTLVFYCLPSSLLQNMLEDIVSHALRTVFNQLLLRSRGYICWKRGMQIQYNLTRLEEWASSAELAISLSGTGIDRPSGASRLRPVTESFERLLQATKLMQLSKSQEDAASLDLLMHVCWLMTPPQILKLLSLYRPIGMEDPVAPGLLSGITERVIAWKAGFKGQQDGSGELPLLLDTVAPPRPLDLSGEPGP